MTDYGSKSTVYLRWKIQPIKLNYPFYTASGKLPVLNKYTRKCPAGKGPTATCKRIGALCYLFRSYCKNARIFTCTRHLQEWGQHRQRKLDAKPVTNREKVETELLWYSHEETLGFESDPLEWWKLKSATHPNLSVQVQRMWTLPASSVRSEEIFQQLATSLLSKGINFYLNMWTCWVFFHASGHDCSRLCIRYVV